MHGAGPWSPPIASSAILVLAVVIVVSTLRKHTYYGAEFTGSMVVECRGEARTTQLIDRKTKTAQTARLAGPSGQNRQTELHLFDLNDGLALVGAAIQAGVMGELQLVTLWAD